MMLAYYDKGVRTENLMFFDCGFCNVWVCVCASACVSLVASDINIIHPWAFVVLSLGFFYEF